MKKICLMLTVLVSFLLISCASTPEAASYVVDIEYETDSPAVTLQVEVINNGMSGGILGRLFSDNSTLNGFRCSFKNNTDKVVRVVWSESSLNYNGTSYVPFIEGQKYVDSNSPMTPAAIPKGGSITKTVFSSNQADLEVNKGKSKWNIQSLDSEEVQLLFMIKSENGEEYITATVTKL